MTITGRSPRQFLKPTLMLLAALGIGACATTDPRPSNTAAGDSLTLTPPPNFTRGLIAQRAPPPFYPLRARGAGVEGWVMLSFAVDANGLVVPNSIETVEEEPVGFFEQAAVNAARRMSFENTRGQLVDDVRYVFRFELEERNRNLPAPPSDEIQFRELIPLRFITPEYPEVARELAIEGYVIVDFTVNRQGGVEDIRIVESEPEGVFNDAALQAARRLRFEPRIVFDGPVTVENVRYRFDWSLPDQGE